MNVSLPVLRTHDNTMHSTFERCHRLYFLNYVRNLVPKGRSPALDFGSLFHLGLNIWYGGMAFGAEPEETFEAALQAMMQAEYVESEDYRTRERCILTFGEYVDFWGWKETKQGWNWKVVFSETGFDTEVAPGLSWGGKIDLAVEWRDQLWLVDHKTTSRFSNSEGGPSADSDFYAQFVPDTQTCGYAKAASVLSGRPVAGVIMNVIVVHRVKKPAIQQFKRKAFDYPAYYFVEWEEQVRDSLSQIGQCTQRNQWRPRWQNCVTKYGKCPAYYLCRTMPENREAKLSAEWEERTWDWRSVEGGLSENNP